MHISQNKLFVITKLELHFLNWYIICILKTVFYKIKIQTFRDKIM